MQRGMSETKTEKHVFQAEVRQLLDIVIHSLYTDKEIFIRELISNASDALEKLRHFELEGREIYDSGLAKEINITTDESAGTITIQDFGIGMTHDELIENLGTIAHSGSKAFAAMLKQSKESGASVGDTANLIGQFGVGFYSAFMVAREVKVFTRSWKAEGENLVWSSDGLGSYAIDRTPDTQRRGAKIVIYLKDDEKRFAQASTVDAIIKRYSSFVRFPINLNGKKINTVEALWMRQKGGVKDEEYKEFYKFHANAFDDPRFTLHFSADAPLAINALLFVPNDNLERFGMGRVESGVSLYCKKILIDDKPEGLLPEWMRFLKGVIDSADLPLNISRESMQDSSLVKKLNQVITGRFLKFLEEKATKAPEDYDAFYKAFGVFLKEGVTTDFAHRDRIAGLLRFESSLTEPGKSTSLADYVSRMKEGQKEIYYLHAPQRAQIENGPYLEAFRAQSIEVLFLYEPIDEFVMSHLGRFQEKELTAADQADLKLDDVSSTGEGEPLPDDQLKALCGWMKDTLGDAVTEVVASKRLVGSPALATNADKFMSASMRRFMRAMNQEEVGPARVKLEINPRSPLIHGLAARRDSQPELAAELARQILDNCLVSAGLLDDPRTMVNRIYKIMEQLAK